VAVKIKLKRLGKIHAPQYRIVVADSRTARNGRSIEEIGLYQPMEDPSVIKVDSARVQYWLGVGALPTEAVTAILKVTGDWQKFKGLPGAEGTLRVAEPKVSRLVKFEAAIQDAAKEPKAPVKKPKLEVPVAEVVAAEVVAEEVAVAEVAAAEVVAEEVAIAEVVAAEVVAEEVAAAEVAAAEVVAEEVIAEEEVAVADADEATA